MSTKTVPTSDQIMELCNNNVQMARYFQDFFEQLNRITGVLSSNVTVVTSDTVLSEDNYVVLADAYETDGYGINVSLPPAFGISGREYVIKKIDVSSNIVTVTPDGYDTIDGYDEIDLAISMDSVHLITNGARWYEI